MTTSFRTEENNQSGAISFANNDNIKLTATGPELLGVPNAPTAIPNTNTTQVATTAFVGAAVAAGVASGGTQPSNNIPSANTAAGAAGLATTYSRGDHSHPGAVPATSIPAQSTSSGTVGSDTTFARGDHAHPHGSQSLISSGYITLPGGLILQWGFNTFSSAGSVVNFSVPFSSACFSVTATAASSSGTENATVYGQNTSSFTGKTANSIGCFWMAVGR